MEKELLIRKTFPFFEKDLIHEIADSSTLFDLRSGQRLMDEGDYIKSFPMVIDGSLRVVRISDEGDELLLYYLNRGEMCTMSLTCCMGLKKSNIKIICEEPAVFLLIPVDRPETWMTDYRTWKEFMMYSYRRRFEQLLGTIDSIAFMDLETRLRRFFIERFRVTGKSIFYGTHQDIALQLNTSREIISRQLRKLEKNNLVVTERNSVNYTRLIRN